METVLVFGVVLLAAVLISDLADRSILSTAVVFLAAGFVAGEGVLGIIDAGDGAVVGAFAELALFSVLFTDGMRVGVKDLMAAWRLPGQVLALGLPLTLLATALFGVLLAGLALPEAFLIGAALSPTDPVFAAAIVGRAEIPHRVRHLLNVESGLNDGLALPFVIVLLDVVTSEHTHWTGLGTEVALGVALGVALPWAAIRVEASRFVRAAGVYEPLHVVAIGVLLFAIASLTHANLFLAAFAGGVTVASTSERARDTFREFGELVAELLKLGALLLFGALIAPSFLPEIGLGGYLFAVAAMFVARPAAVFVSLLRSGLPSQERTVVAWFGPKGFASVVYGLLIVEADFARGEKLFHLIAIVVAMSIVLHSSTDVLVARWFERKAPWPKLRRPRAATGEHQ
ncbi:MAG TPA: cation:proton antiporter [Acidimicrobiales bacterium]